MRETPSEEPSLLQLLIEVLRNSKNIRHTEHRGTHWVKGLREKQCTTCKEPLIPDNEIECAIHLYHADVKTNGEFTPYYFELYCDKCHAKVKEETKIEWSRKA